MLSADVMGSSFSAYPHLRDRLPGSGQRNRIDQCFARDEVVVDGEVLLMYSTNLQVELAPLVRRLRNPYRSGGGLVYKSCNIGRAWITPTVDIGR
jgi:uncharacterized protein (AIM24 family)